MQKQPPSFTKDRYPLRFPASMRERLAELAKEHGRSLNSEIIQRLEDSIAREESGNYATGEEGVSRDDVLTLLLHGMTAGLDAFERARDAGGSSADMHRAMKQAVLDAIKEEQND